MDYQRIYNQLIEKSVGRLLTGYTENHHIIPKCMGGNDVETNIAKLTPEEHFLAHQLLARIYPENPKLIFALHRMTSGKYRNNKLYGWIRRRHAEAMSRFVRTEEHCKNISKSKVGKPSKKKGRFVTDDVRLVKIQTPFGIFLSYAEAGRSIGIGRFIIMYRCKSKNFTDWYIL